MTNAVSPTSEVAPSRWCANTDLMVSVILALVLTASWAAMDWARLSHMMLPDNDDMMRLAQVRDWLAGQAINDWTQYRLAPPYGGPMHWSRIGDLGVASLILLAWPLAGQADAEMIAVLVYPGLLFACAMFLSARIGRRLWGPTAGPVAALITALALPGTTIFAPGRIDHHGLQAVLLQLLVLMLMRASTLRNGFIAGAVTAVSLMVGLETAPHIAALIAVMASLWLARGFGERARIAGFGAGLGATTLLFLAFLRPTLWSVKFCDAFTPASVTAALALAAAFALLAAVSGQLADWRARAAAGVAVGTIASGATLLAFPSCVSGPYGEVDPFLLSAFLSNISEARSVFAQASVAKTIAYGGVLTVASITAVWTLFREWQRWPVLLPIAAAVIISMGIALFQIRGTYIGAPLGAPLLAGLVVAARKRPRFQLVWVIWAWLASSGQTYASIPPRIQQAFRSEGAPAEPVSGRLACSIGDTWKQVGRYPSGTVMAGINSASYLIGATHHSTVGAAYHRNNAGNMAMYRFFLSPPEHSRVIAREWRTDYVVFCPGDFGEIDVTRRYPHSLAARLQRGDVPAWLEPLPLDKTPLRLFRVR